MFVFTRQPTTDSVAQLVYLPGAEVRVLFFYNECKRIGLRSFNQWGAFKTGFVGTK